MPPPCPPPPPAFCLHHIIIATMMCNGTAHRRCNDGVLLKFRKPYAQRIMQKA